MRFLNCPSYDLKRHSHLNRDDKWKAGITNRRAYTTISTVSLDVMQVIWAATRADCFLVLYFVSKFKSGKNEKNSAERLASMLCGMLHYEIFHQHEQSPVSSLTSAFLWMNTRNMSCSDPQFIISLNFCWWLSSLERFWRNSIAMF